MTKPWKEDLKGLMGLDYITLKNSPMIMDINGPLINIEEEDADTLEKLIIKAVIENQIPITGNEVAFFRKTLGFSRNGFSNKLNIDYELLASWERDRKGRLNPEDEEMIRKFALEAIGSKFVGIFDVIFLNNELIIDLESSFDKQMKDILK